MNYKKTFTTLAGATLLAQLISILFIPFIARVFPPESFAEFTFWAAMGGLIGGVFSLKQEQFFLSRPKSEWPEIIARIFVIYKCGIAAFLAFTAIYLVIGQLGKGLSVLLTFLYSLLTSLIISFTNIANVQEAFPALAKSRIIMSTVLGSTQLAVSIFSTSSDALLIGAVLSQLLLLIYLYPKANIGTFLSIKNEATLPRRNDVKISLHSIFSSITLSVAMSFPPVLLFSLGYHFEAGIVALLQRCMLMPVNLLAAPASQVLVVFLRRNQQQKISNRLLAQSTTAIALAYICSYLLTAAASELKLLTYILGQQWKAADLLAASVVSIYVSLLIRNISVQYFLVRERQSSLMQIDVLFLILLGVGYAAASAHYLALQQYLLVMNVTYFIYMLAPLVYIAIHNSFKTSTYP